MGAGAEAQTADARAMDDKAKKEVRENAEAAAQKTLRMHDIAKGNVAMVATMDHVYQEELDHDPVRKLNQEWSAAAEGEGIATHYYSESEAATLYKKSPQQLIAEHIVMPLGKKAVMDQNGDPVIDAATGMPKFEGQLVAIDGMKDSQFSKGVPQSFVDAVKKYAPLSGQGITGLDALTADHPMSIQDFTRLHTAIQEGRKAELAGWVEKTPGANAVEDPKDPKGVLQYNPLTQETRAYKGGKPLAVTKEQSEINKKDNSGDVTDLERFKQDREDARADRKNKSDNQFSPPSAGNSQGEQYLSTLPQEDQATIKSIAEGRNHVAIQNRKGELTPLGQALMRAYPDYDDAKAAGSYDRFRR